MYRKFSFLGGIAAAALFMTADAPAENATAAANTPKTSKSIVPTKYGSKYKGGGTDELAAFINKQCVGKDGFEYPAFFELCKKNGLDGAKVDHYSAQVAEKRHGSQGRARMTLRNMLATIARKNGKLIAIDGSEVEVTLPKTVLAGAAAEAKAKADTATTETASEAGAESSTSESGNEPEGEDKAA